MRFQGGNKNDSNSIVIPEEETLALSNGIFIFFLNNVVELNTRGKTNGFHLKGLCSQLEAPMLFLTRCVLGSNPEFVF